MSDITSLPYQKIHKPKIEEVIPYKLDGDMQKIALDFAAYLKSIKVNLKWQTCNRWSAVSKGKHICGIEMSESRLRKPEQEKIFWSIHLNLKNINEYENDVMSEGLQNFVWDKWKLCNFCWSGHDGGIEGTILNKKFTNICVNVPARHNRFDINNPDTTEIPLIKMLLEFEKKITIIK